MHVQKSCTSTKFVTINFLDVMKVQYSFRSKRGKQINLTFSFSSLTLSLDFGLSCKGSKCKCSKDAFVFSGLDKKCVEKGTWSSSRIASPVIHSIQHLKYSQGSMGIRVLQIQWIHVTKDYILDAILLVPKNVFAHQSIHCITPRWGNVIRLGTRLRNHSLVLFS